MQIQELPGGSAYPAYALDGTTLTVADHPVDMATRQTDRPITIDLSRRDGAVVEQSGPRMVATIIVPAATYSLVDTGDTDEDDNPIYDRVQDPLDTSAVDLRLFPEDS